MSAPTRRWIVVALPALALVAAGLGPAVRAQEATPGAMAGMTEEAHPAHIHEGTCDELGGIVFPLEDVIHGGTMGTPGAGTDAMATPGVGRAGMGEAVAESTTTVEASLDEMLAAEHAINVHESAENIETYIACGDLTGTPEEGTLEIELAELNDSGYAGMATLEDNGDGTTTVTVMLMEGDGGVGTPAADDAAASAERAAVTIVDFSYDPAEITVPVGSTVAWTNDDVVPHTATARDREVLQSGTIAAGETYEQTFDTAGTYDYFCEFHPNMEGTVVVE